MTATTHHTILLVEDEENDVLFMKLAMEELGMADGLQVAEDGAQAVDYLSGRGEFSDRTRHPLPALVFLDLKLPRMMGMDVLKWIRDQAELDTMVVIVLTSSQQRSDIRMACSLGANFPDGLQFEKGAQGTALFDQPAAFDQRHPGGVHAFSRHGAGVRSGARGRSASEPAAARGERAVI